jgi:hypothetical protein
MVTGAIPAHLWHVVMADCDVDAANLALLIAGDGSDRLSDK